MTSTLVFLVTAQLAAGGVVDVGISAEARVSQAELVEPADLDPAVATSALVLHPSLSTAVESGSLAGSVAYAPTLSLLTTLSEPDPSLALLHVVELGADARLGDRLSFRSALGGSYGDLDPITAQALFRGSNSARGLASTPYASLGARAGASAVLVRRLNLDVDGRVTVNTAFDAAADPEAPPAEAPLDIPLTISPGVDALLSWRVTRSDSLLGGGTLQGASVSGRGSFIGGGPVVGWRKQLLRDTGFDLLAGVGVYSANDDQLSPILVYIPTAQARISTLVDLPGEAALEGGARAGFDVINDPLGTLIENRGSIGIDAGIRATREIAVRAGVAAAMPAFAYAQRGRTSSATFGAQALVAWSPSDVVELGGGFIGTTRIFEGKPVSDLQVSVSLTAHAPVWHTGGRPTGSGGDTTTSIGVTRIGAPQRLGATTIEEEEPLPPLEEEAPELIPPSGIEPDAASASDDTEGGGSKLRPLTPQEQRELELKKKKKEKKEAEAAEQAEKKAEEAEEADDKDDKPPKEEAKPEG